MIEFFLDGKKVSAKVGDTVLKVCQEQNVFIPTLCHIRGFPTRSVCRMCIVEIKDQPFLSPSCSTEIHDGMEVLTDSAKVQTARRVLIELMLTEHGNCQRSHCEVCELAQKFGISGIRSAEGEAANPQWCDASSDYINIIHESCVHCDRCVRACSSNIISRATVNHKLTMGFQGNTLIADSQCSFCSDCVSACPAGAFTKKI